MNTNIFLSWKYWKTHKRRAFSIVIAIVIGIASVTCLSLMSRGLVVRNMETEFDNYGNYDCAILNVTDKQEKLLLNQADKKYVSCGFMCNVGNAIIKKSEVTFPMYYYDDETVQDLYHLSLIDGHYPQTSGEVVISQDYANALGIIAEVGTEITIDFKDLEDVSHSNTYTVVGIVSNSKNYRYLSLDISLPEIFVYKEDFQDFKTSKIFLEQEDYTNSDFYLWTLIIYSDEEQITNNIDNTPENASIYRSMKYSHGDRQGIYMNILGTRDYFSDYDSKNVINERIESNNVDGDFNSTVLVPIFSTIILILMIISIYSSVKISMEERIKQFGMLRCIGLSAKQSTVMMFVETGIISIISFVIGIILGIVTYVLINLIQKDIFNIPVYWAFSVNKIVSAVTINPYVYSITIGLVSIIIATIIPSIKMLKLTPLQAYHNGTPKKFYSKRFRKTNAIRLLNSRLKNSLSLLIAISFILSMSSCAFGLLYFGSFSDNQTVKYKRQIDESGLYNCDYVLRKNFMYSVAYDVTNRHDCGISSEDIESMYQNPNIESINLMMIEPGTRISYEDTEENQIYDTVLYRSNIDVLNNVEKFEKYKDDMKMAEGYTSNEKVYNVPTVGLTDNEILELQKYVISGNIDVNALKDGSQVIWVTLSDEIAEYLEIYNIHENPYKVGDVLSLSNIYLEDYDKYNFSKDLPDIVFNNPIVTFQEDNETYKMYSIGVINTITRYQASIGAIIEFTDIDIAKQYFCTDTWGKCGFNIICDYNAYSNWGFNFDKFTNVGISLKNPNDKDFVTLLNQISSSNDELELYSASDLKKSIYAENISIMSSCMAILILILLISIINIWNSFNYSIKQQIEQISILQSLGMSFKNIKKMVFFRNIKYPLVAIPFMIIPIIIFKIARNKAIDIVFSAIDDNEKYTMAGWYNSFPLYIDLVKQPILLIFILIIIISILITLIINSISLKSIKNSSIIDNIRKEDF